MNQDIESQDEPRAQHVFGRRKGKKLRSHHTGLMETLLPRLNALIFVEERRADPAPAKALWLEIGFGGGEHLAAQAAAQSGVDFIGCEPFVNGVAKLLAQIEARSLRNVRVHADDATPLLSALPEATVDRAYVLFPDPWPKRRQRKRRFLNDDSLAQMARVMKPNAEFRFATDIDDYAGWVLARILGSADFEWKVGSSAGWLTPWPDHTRTRYEQKARREGRTPMFFTFSRRP